MEYNEEEGIQEEEYQENEYIYNLWREQYENKRCDKTGDDQEFSLWQ
tara:strand:+ start:1081 stop:1221 length:141 start_codon:yes stop_codon:yes gene_type:complete